jgi:hypothetical protein
MQASTSWRKSTASEQGGSDCVEVAFARVGASVRDSKNATGPVLDLSERAWRRFVVDLQR